MHCQVHRHVHSKVRPGVIPKTVSRYRRCSACSRITKPLETFIAVEAKRNEPFGDVQNLDLGNVQTAIGIYLVQLSSDSQIYDVLALICLYMIFVSEIDNGEHPKSSSSSF